MPAKVCPCIVMNKLMVFLGAPHAAAMHKDPEREQTPSDQLTHMDEEEEHVLPLLYGSGHPEAVMAANEIAMDHEYFRAQIKIFGRIKAEKKWEAHARLEDLVVLKYLGYLIDPVEYPRPGAVVARGMRVYRRAG